MTTFFPTFWCVGPLYGEIDPIRARAIDHSVLYLWACYFSWVFEVLEVSELPSLNSMKLLVPFKCLEHLLECQIFIVSSTNKIWHNLIQVLSIKLICLIFAHSFSNLTYILYSGKKCFKTDILDTALDTWIWTPDASSFVNLFLQIIISCNQHINCILKFAKITFIYTSCILLWYTSWYF